MELFDRKKYIANLEDQELLSSCTKEREHTDLITIVRVLLSLVDKIEDGYTFQKINELNEKNAFTGISSQNTMRQTINTIVNDAISFKGNSNDDAEDKLLYDAMDVIIKKYNLSDMNQLIAKLKEFEMSFETIQTLANLINSVVPNQITDIQSLVTYVTELIRNVTSAQANANNMFTNLNAVLNENALLKAQIQNYKQQLASLGGVSV